MAGKLNISPGESISELRAVLKSFDTRVKLFKILFRGKGPEFDGFSLYAPDIDASDLDWKASVRAGKLLVRKYKEERDLSFLFVIDVGDSMVSGSAPLLKCEYAANVAIAFSDLIMSSGDRVGFLLYSDRVVDFQRPAKGQKQFALLVDHLSNTKYYGGKSRIDVALEHLVNEIGPRINIVIFISDFSFVPKRASTFLREAGGIYESIAIMIRDPVDEKLPEISGNYIVKDPHSERVLVVDPKVAAYQYAEAVRIKEQETIRILKENGTDTLKLESNKGFAIPLSNFLRERVAMKGGE